MRVGNEVGTRVLGKLAVKLLAVGKAPLGIVRRLFCIFLETHNAGAKNILSSL